MKGLRFSLLHYQEGLVLLDAVPKVAYARPLHSELLADARTTIADPSWAWVSRRQWSRAVPERAGSRVNYR